VLELADLEKPREWKGEPIPQAPGKSLVPALNKDEVIPRESLWWYHEGNRALRVGNWKIVAAKGEPWELYDVGNDRAEQVNLASAMPEKLHALERTWLKQTTAIEILARKTTAKP
jgi:arylsulfatase